MCVSTQNSKEFLSYQKSSVSTSPQHLQRMGLSSLLQQIEKRGKLPSKPQPQPAKDEVKKSESNVSPLRSSGSDRYVDPVVARLKEKRRLEREQAEAARAKQNGNKSTKSSTTSRPAVYKTPSNSVSRPKQNVTKVTQSKWDDEPKPPPAKKKMSFNELMKKAKQIDHDKLSIKFPQKSASPEAAISSKTAPKKNTTVNRQPVATKNSSYGLQHNRRPTTEKNEVQRRSDPPVRKRLPKVPMPARQPNAKIQERLKQRRSKAAQDRGYAYNEDEDDDLSDFLVSDEEGGVVEDGYNRDEIWAMFNKGKKRKYYEYNDYEDDDYDMEATGADVLEEELRSRLDAEREDRREMEQEKQRALEKQKRKMRR